MNNCTCHPGTTCTSVESCAAARRAEFGDVADYKAIREALAAGPTEGPWFEHHDKGHLYIENQRDDVICDMGLRAKSSPTSQFIAACNPAAIRALLADLDAARAALSEAKAGGWVDVPVEPVAYRVDWPVEAGVGMRRFYGADEWESARGTVEFFGGIPVPLAPLPAPPAQRDNT